jgi:carboxymethylenebutenolidase
MPQMQSFTSPAGLGFNRDVGPSYDEASATLAMQRTLAFLDQHVASA